MIFYNNNNNMFVLFEKNVYLLYIIIDTKSRYDNIVFDQ